MRKLIAVGVLALGAWAGAETAMYEVQGLSCHKADVTYWVNGGIQQEQDVNLPWRKVVKGEIGSPLSLTAQAKCKAADTAIYALITAGENDNTNDSKGPYAVVASTATIGQREKPSMTNKGTPGIPYLFVASKPGHGDVPDLKVNKFGDDFLLNNGTNKLLLTNKSIRAKLNGKQITLADSPFIEPKAPSYIFVPASALRLIGCTMRSDYLPYLLPIKCRPDSEYNDATPSVW